MKASGKLIALGLMAAALSVGSVTGAQAQATQGTGANAPAVPSAAPGSQSKTKNVEQVPGAPGTAQSGAKKHVTGTQPAAPASKPGSQETPGATTQGQSTTK
jgi:hypothetical protein